MKKALLLVILTSIVFMGFAQSRSALDLTVNKFQTLYNTNQNKEIFNLLSERIQTLMPLEQTEAAMQQLHGQYGDMKSYKYAKEEQGQSFYDVVFANGTASLIMAIDDAKKITAFRFVPSESKKATGSNFSYASTNGKIYGTILTPKDKKTAPVVLIIAGSGPTDRDGNQTSVKASTYKMIAEDLQKAGIASLRYDKRGVGESASALKDESTLVFDDMVNDAVGIINKLKSDKRFTSVIVLGHSEGSLVGMMAAAKSKADGYISVSGLAEKADKIIVRQIAAQSEELSLKAAFLLDSLSKGKEITTVDPNLQSLFRPSVQSYITSWIKYEPKTEIQRLQIPVLILQGTTDIQVPVSQAETLKEAYPKATLKVIKGMNHILKQAPEERAKNIATYSDPNLPLSKELMPAINTFVTALGKK